MEWMFIKKMFCGKLILNGGIILNKKVGIIFCFFFFRSIKILIFNSQKGGQFRAIY